MVNKKPHRKPLNATTTPHTTKNYTIATYVPQLTVKLLEERDDWANPMQAKGIGELGICGAAATITNVIFNATGVRVRDYPATLDKVIAGM